MVERDDNKVCVVGATTAWPFYQQTGAYVCQANRYFQEDTARLGFYTHRLIQGVAPKILQILPSVDLSDDQIAHSALHALPLERWIGTVLAAAVEVGVTEPAVQVVMLTPLHHEGTAQFDAVRHDLRGAWTQKQRYARLDQLRRARTTADLDFDRVSGREP